MTIQHAIFETHPAMFNLHTGETWVLFGRRSIGWRKLQLAEMQQFAQPISKAQFNRLYPGLPPLPEVAFRFSD
jgi:hypothetical protein